MQVVRGKNRHLINITSLILAAIATSHPASAGEPGTAVITLQPVPPKTLPPSEYPPGTTIVGQEIILGSVPARVWLDVYITGWAPNLKTVQATLSVTNFEEDGGGFRGENAECLGAPANEAADLYYAFQLCDTHADCRAGLGGRSDPCELGDFAFCTHYPVGGNRYFEQTYCTSYFQHECVGNWIGHDQSYINAIDLHFGIAFGITFDEGSSAVDFHPSYLGTVVLDIPSNANGTYTIDFSELQTFWYPEGPPGTHCGGLPCPVELQAAKITVPCGRCCYGLGEGDAGCIDRVSATACAGYGAGAVFHANETCSDDGSAASCLPRIPAASSWGLVALTILLLIAAKVSYRFRAVS
jgi:hypothetical protein